MLTKDWLRKEFEKEHKKYYEVELFRKEGFERKRCSVCGKAFWSTGETETCGDSSHNDYSFIGKKKKTDVLDYQQFWKKYADFWKKNGHEVVPRYPVISRWRDDLYFTIASIVDFQRLENGKIVFEYPANPLIVPQVCLRFNDIANVGVTGRHLSCFTMAGQHAFVESGKLKGVSKGKIEGKGYGKDECIQYNYDFLNSVLKIPKNEIFYSEDIWNMPDFSAFGPCIESFSAGLELVNSVFMQFRAKNGGGNAHSGHADAAFEELDTKVIDVGWGFERLLWFYNGTPTVYDSIFPKEIEFMKKRSSIELKHELFERYAKLSAKLDVEEVHNLKEEREKIAKNLGISLAELEKGIAPLQGIYAIADHARAMLFSLSDGALPSNAAGGYNLRVLLRRALSFISDYDFQFELFDIMEMQAKNYREIYPELSENLEEIKEIIEVEKRKYETTYSKAKRMAMEVVQKGSITSEKMQMLYESHGVTPEIIERAAKESKIAVPEIPTDFYAKLTAKHIMEKKEPKKKTEEFQKTKPLYYEKQMIVETEAEVLGVVGNSLVLDRTIFYPEGGGQMTDKGMINESKMEKAEKIGDVVFHHLAENESHKFRKGQKVLLKLNEKRRLALQRHHSATHLIIATAREVLGKHIWQAGSKKEEDFAHLDMTHFAKLTREQQNEIEKRVNRKVSEAHKITATIMNRGDAEKKYGFRLYQGGGAIGKEIRVIEVEGIDVEACGGLHMGNTSEVGYVKLMGSEQIQDGVLRVYYKAGEKALEYVQMEEEKMEEAASVLSVSKAELPSAAKRFFEEWKERGKSIGQMNEKIAELEMEREMALLEKREGGKAKLIEKKISQPMNILERMALEMAKKGVDALLQNDEGFVVVACAESSPNDAIELLKKTGAKGGGNKSFARGKITKT